MQGLSFIGSIVFAVLLLCALGNVIAQQGQTLRIVKGKKVTLRANAEHALSYIWFHNGEAVYGKHESRIVVTEGGEYTVIAFGDGCNSDLSDPIRIVVDPLSEEVQVDIEIRNLPDSERALVSQEFNFQFLVLNNSDVAADQLLVTISLPKQLVYLGTIQGEDTDLMYNAFKNELTWRLTRLEGKESVSQGVRLRGNYTGQAVVTARVSSKQEDSNIANNEDHTTVDIITFFVPNVITPNGDGKNDTFKIIGLDSFKSNKLYIYNRFGGEVFRSINYQNNWAGEGLREGTYFYYLEIEDWTGSVHRDKGNVLLVREIVYQ